jgi:plasminogen activator inhibitor 1 RNA-binding protein
MRSGKRDGTDAPKPAPERLGNQNQNRAKQSASGNENGTSSRGAVARLHKTCTHATCLDWAN